jgi:hypothetical protein
MKKSVKKKRTMRLRLQDFETKIRVRPLLIEDFEELMGMQQLCFPGMAGWTKEQLESQLSHFPDGQVVLE